MTSEEILRCLRGADRAAAFEYLNSELLPRAVERMNRDALPVRLAVFDTDRLPSNQRNLTDVRTRVGNLLEWELGLAVGIEAAVHVNDQLRLVYVVANRFPDFEFRGIDGSRGLRLEVKAVDVVAEEKAANFDTLLKDIRAGCDYVVTMIWRLHRPNGALLRFPYVECAIALDAEHLAKMRDIYWLNTPPPTAASARQGFDLRFPINCSGDAFNKEEGNAGKLMRLFDPRFEKYLPDEIRRSPTLPKYFQLRERIVQGGFRQIAGRLGGAFGGVRVAENFTGTGASIVFERGGRHLVILGDAEKPSRATALAVGGAHRPVAAVLVLNEKFQWSAYREDGVRLGEDRKPEAAERLVRSL